MTYAVLGSLAQTLHQILNHDENPLLINGKQHLVLLREQVILLRKFLEKFPDEAKTLETRIREAANGAEDVIEHFMYDHIRSSIAGERATDIEYDFRELEMVMAEIDSMARETTDITSGNVKLSNPPPTQSAPSSSLVPASLFNSTVTVGLDEDLEKIKDLVVPFSPNGQTVIPITGMGGIGKTTLAKMVYHDPLVMEKFHVRAWVTVSQGYKLENIFSDLLYSLQRIVGEGSVESGDSNENKIYKILWERKYLIVLDDLWSKKAWDEIQKAFPYHTKGSRIMITTRNENVGNHARILSSLHRMHLMNPNQSWELLKKKVFPNKECPPGLEKVGKDIAKGCEGLPLAIVVIAGILSTISETPSSWEEVAENIRSLIHKDVHFQKIMFLSYTDLPLDLRYCFIYMGGFPEDYEIPVSKLIKLWMAEGFVKHQKEAVECVDDLKMRSLALVTATKSNGKIRSCILHNFVRDLCRTIALDENFERRVSNAHSDLRCPAKANASTLRSVICFRPTESSLLGIRKLRLVRVLDVVDTHAYSLPPQVFDLFHLRYLAFGFSMEIPVAISRLHNLRTLIIRPSKGMRRYSKDEVYLPLEVWMLPLLENLVSLFDLLPDPEGAAAALKNLLTLSVVKKFICTKQMMGMIPNVKKLGITYFGDIYQQDYQLNNLVLLHQLEKLTLVLKADHPVRLRFNPVFPRKLKKLTLSGWRLSWDNMGIISSLPELKVLKLKNHACKGFWWETYEDKFLNLECLVIDESDLKCWFTKKGHFLRLRRLVIYRCPSLRRIPENFTYLSKLELIEVDYANESLVEYVKQIPEDRHNLGLGDGSFQVRVVHYQGS